MLYTMQMAVRPASVSRRACAPAAVTVALKMLVPQAARLWLKQVSQPTVRFEAAQQARFIGSNTL